tara:strand:+ start:1452 stop:1832 length:381 start_codon:yes stop_codon:yes gene_type:complete
MIKVITYGTFDTFHYGHFFLLERAKALGDHLTVCISTDEFNMNQKRKIAKLNFSERVRIIKSLNFVDYIHPEKSWDQKILDIKNYNINIFAIGEDWKGKFDFLKSYCDVVYLPRTNDVSSTLIRGY